MSLSPRAIASANAQETGEVWVWLLEISPPSGPVLRYCDQHVAVVSNGQTYRPLAFKARLADSVDGGIPSAQIVLDDVLRAVSQAVRSAGEPTPVTARVVLAETPNTIEREIDGEITTGEIGSGQITVTLTESTVMDEAAVQHIMTPGYMPGLSR